MFEARGNVLTSLMVFVIVGLCVDNSNGQNFFDQDMTSGVGCAGGVKSALEAYEDVHACKGHWNGHVENAGHICARQWHVCSWNDSDVLETVRWYDATHTGGCYAINAAHNSGSCTECSSETDAEMAAIGADCPNQDPSAKSCFGTGKIDGSCCRSEHSYRPCHSTPWLTGVLCCRNVIDGAKPTIVKSPSAVVLAKVGKSATLECKTSGNPRPTIHWFKDGLEIPTPLISSEYSADSDGLTIFRASEKHSGLYQCKAVNKHGVASSYKSKVRVYDPNPEVVACKDTSQQQLLHGNQFATCGGRWKGHIKKATKQLCAAGWHVCSTKDRTAMQELSWETLSAIDGCFAYNAASTSYFECSKCSPRKKGNRMSGVGGGCGHSNLEMSSCLSNGRMDMFATRNQAAEFDVGTSVFGENKVLDSDKSARTCNYVSGSTDGVLCCRDKIKKRKKKAKSRGKCRKSCMNGGRCVGKNTCLCEAGFTGETCEIVEDRCKVPCGPNAYCGSKGSCKCEKGYKMDEYNVCVSRDPHIRKQESVKKGKLHHLLVPDVVPLCGNVQCLNGGKCKRKKCYCPPPFYGESCELKHQRVSWPSYYFRTFLERIG